MIITRQIALSRILKGTWKTTLILLAVSTTAYLFNAFVINHLFKFPAVIPSMLGPGLAFFIGFNNNQAYDRWWEARKIWGALVNDSRTWARQIINYTPSGANETDEVKGLKKQLIKRHIGFLYALKENLRGTNNMEFHQFLSPNELEQVNKESNKHNAILSFQSKDLNTLYENKIIDGFKFMEFNHMIVGFCNEMGKSERIKNTIFPSTYIFYTRVFIWLLVIAMIFVLSDLVGIWSIPFGIVTGYIFLVTHNVGLAIMNPFEPIPSGISIDQITRTIEINLLEMMGEKEIPEPVQSVNGEYIM